MNQFREGTTQALERHLASRASANDAQIDTHGGRLEEGGEDEEALSRCTSPRRAADTVAVAVAVVFLAFVLWARCTQSVGDSV